MSAVRRVRLKAFAKINLTLEVLNKRRDGYHDLRTIFQTISLADTLAIEFTRARRTTLELDSSVDIANNLVIRAAAAVLDAMRLTAKVRFHLMKRIPMGGGLGGGSTDGAAVLLALPALAGRTIPMAELLALAVELGSDVPFFLSGGCALGLGRGTELYVLGDPPQVRGLVIAPPVHVSTADAYGFLNRTEAQLPAAEARLLDSRDWRRFCVNDFEPAVFRQHPDLDTIQRKLCKLGARPARMTGSGAALFGIFDQTEGLNRARKAFPDCKVYPFTFISRRRYQAIWRKQLL